MSFTTSVDYSLWGAGAEAISTGKEATVKAFVLHRITILVAAIAVGGAGISTDALARGGGHGGSAIGEGHLGETGGGRFGGGAAHPGYGHSRGWGRPYDYYADYEECLQQGTAQRLAGSGRHAYT